MKNVFILSFVLVSITSCINIKKSEVKEETIHSLNAFTKKYGTNPKYMGAEYLKILNKESLLEKKYSYALKSMQSLPLEKNIDDISKLLENKELFNNKLFKPFNSSSLSQAVYQNNQAIVSFSFKQDAISVIFADFLLRIKNKKLLIYTLEHAVGCGGPPIAIFEQEDISIPTETNITKK